MSSEILLSPTYRKWEISYLRHQKWDGPGRLKMLKSSELIHRELLAFDPNKKNCDARQAQYIVIRYTSNGGGGSGSRPGTRRRQWTRRRGDCSGPGNAATAADLGTRRQRQRTRARGGSGSGPGDATGQVTQPKRGVWWEAYWCLQLDTAIIGNIQVTLFLLLWFWYQILYRMKMSQRFLFRIVDFAIRSIILLLSGSHNKN